jgi:D-alanyl-D-alanine carboxypeptidase (penicillin-binding protein 5/6)
MLMNAARTMAAALAGAAALASAAAVTAVAATPAGAAQVASGSSPAASAAPPNAVPPNRLDVGGTRLASSGIVVNYPGRGARRLPKVPASAYVIADASTGRVLAAKDAHGEFPPASTLKVLTAITLIPRLSPNAMVVATRQATSVEPNVVGLIRGRRYRVSDLFTALLTISANDAAVALAQATGSFQAGVALMNAEAHHLQAYDVVARQPNGLPAPGQHASAYDLALIARQALAMPAFMKYDSTVAARFLVKPRHRVTLVNQNTLLTGYRGGIGGKIGWTEKAEATYIGLARRGGVTLIVTLLHCTPLQEITSGERLLNWGFAMAGHVAPVGDLVPPLPAVTAAHPAPSAATRSPGAALSPAAGTSARPAPARARRAVAAAEATAAPSAPLPVIPLLAGAGLVAVAALGLGWLSRLRGRSG